MFCFVPILQAVLFEVAIKWSSPQCCEYKTAKIAQTECQELKLGHFSYSSF